MAVKYVQITEMGINVRCQKDTVAAVKLSLEIRGTVCCLSPPIGSKKEAPLQAGAPPPISGGNSPLYFTTSAITIFSILEQAYQKQCKNQP